MPKLPYVYACMYVLKNHKQTAIERNVYTTWDASLQDLCGRIPWGT
jgi:hypothetical protein